MVVDVRVLLDHAEFVVLTQLDLLAGLSLPFLRFTGLTSDLLASLIWQRWFLEGITVHRSAFLCLQIRPMRHVSDIRAVMGASFVASLPLMVTATSLCQLLRFGGLDLPLLAVFKVKADLPLLLEDGLRDVVIRHLVGPLLVQERLPVHGVLPRVMGLVLAVVEQGCVLVAIHWGLPTIRHLHTGLCVQAPRRRHSFLLSLADVDHCVFDVLVCDVAVARIAALPSLL